MKPAYAVWIASGLYAAVMSALGVVRYVTYHSGADLGIFVQAIATVFRGFADTPEGGSHFTVHFSPILYLCAPFLLAAHSPIALIALQACAGALTAPAIYLLARKRMEDRLAALVAVVALLYPALVGQTFTDFHENGFAPASIAWLAWAVDARRWRLAALFAALTLGIKEDEAAILAVLGVFFAIVSARMGDRQAARFGAGVGAVAAAVFIAYFAVVRPLAGATGHWYVIESLAGHHADEQHGLNLIVGRATFMLEVLLPLAFLPLLSRGFLLAIPGLLEVLSSRWSITYTMGQHYAGVWIAWVLVAFALAVAKIAAGKPARAHLLVRACIALCVLNLAVASPTHWGHFLRTRNAHDAALDRIIAQVPPDSPVGTFDEAYAHLGFNRHAQIGLGAQPEYALFDERYDSAAWRALYRPQLEAFVRAGTYAPIASDDGVTLYRRVKGAIWRPALM